MPTTAQLLEQILRANPGASLAYFRADPDGPRLVIHVTNPTRQDQLLLPAAACRLAPQVILTPPLKTLIAPVESPAPRTIHTECQNEPLQLGCQVQPAAGNWVGTAGAPVRWTDNDARHHWGILSNWHVMASGQDLAAALHQPDRSNPRPIAHLTDAAPVRPDQTNTIDAAIADALINGKHTISRNILELGTPNPNPATAAVGLAVTKSGRTTGVTSGVVSAVDAAARVDYGSFVALFAHQIVINDTDGPFSAAGDSGSFIVCHHAHRPVGLLFAGGGNITIANPVAFLVERFHLAFAL